MSAKFKVSLPFPILSLALIAALLHFPSTLTTFAANAYSTFSLLCSLFASAVLYGLHRSTKNGLLKDAAKTASKSSKSEKSKPLPRFVRILLSLSLVYALIYSHHIYALTTLLLSFSINLALRYYSPKVTSAVKATLANNTAVSAS